jgi:hypothetical protein
VGVSNIRFASRRLRRGPAAHRRDSPHLRGSQRWSWPSFPSTENVSHELADASEEARRKPLLGQAVLHREHACRRWVKALLIGVPLVLLGALVLLLVGTPGWVAGAGRSAAVSGLFVVRYVCGAARADRWCSARLLTGPQPSQGCVSSPR